MSWLRVLASRIRGLFSKRRLERDLDEELRAHIEMATEENLRRGMSAEEARYGAQREFGGVEQTKEIYREHRSLIFIETLLRDIRYASRTMRHNRAFSAVAVLSLALGMGVNTAIFTLVNAFGLRPLPVRNPEELFFVGAESEPGNTAGFSYPLFEAVHDRNQTLSGVFVYASGAINVSADGEAELARNGGMYVSDDYFSVLGVRAVAGRTFTSADDQPVAVLSHDYWERRFGRDPSVVGKSIEVNAHPFTVIGVTPRQFFGISVGRSPDVIVPLRLYPQINHSPTQFHSPGNWWLEGMARLKPGVNIAQVTADLNVVFRQHVIQAGMSKEYASWRIALEPGGRGSSPLSKEGANMFLAALAAVVGSVLLIACANVANLLLARNAGRQKEIALRISLGSSRGRLIRQLLTESLLLAAIGGAIALLFASWGVHSLIYFLPEPLAVDLTPDARVLAFTATMSILTTLVFGLVPAFRATRVDLTPSLKEGNVNCAAGPVGNRLRGALVVFQMALSLMLLVLAGLFTRSLQSLAHVELGFRPEHVLVLSVDPTLIGYDGERIATLYKRLLEQLEAIPSVRSTSLSQTGLIGGGVWGNLISIPGHTPRPGQRMDSTFSAVGAHFFQTTGIPILFGRDFTTRDNETAPKVAVINETFARDLFKGDSPLGRTIGLGVGQNLGLFQIVGVVKDSKQRRLNEPPVRVVYFPFLQLPPQQMGRVMLEVRTAGDPAGMIATARRQLLDVEKKLPIFREQTLTQVVEDSMIDQNIKTALAALFGVLALLLACVGLSGVISFSVARRTGEIGIRMALGAQRREVVVMVLREAIALVSIGAAIGLALSLAAGRVVSSQLFGITGSDPLAIGGATLILSATAALAGYLPARHASRVDPMFALRHE
jgi:predicted permease